MVVYEVDVAIADDLRGAYLAWLHAHVAEILALPGFAGAEVMEVVDPTQSGEARFCVHYRLHDATALQEYLRDHAPRLRADGMARFGGRMRAQRRVLVPAGPRLSAPG